MSNNQHIKKVNYLITIGSVTIQQGVVGLSVSNRVNKIPRARLELNYYDTIKEKKEKTIPLQPAASFEQEKPDSKTSFLPGESITIELGMGYDTTEVFTGYITKQHIVANNDGTVFLYIDCKHATHKMTLGTHTRFLHHDVNLNRSSHKKIDPVNDDDILKNIIEQYDKLSIQIEDQQANAFDHENMVQYNCSDWDFLIMRAEATARVCKIHKNQIHIIHPKVAETTDNELVLGKHIFEYEAEYDETKIAQDITIANWGVKDQAAQNETFKNSNANSDASKIQSNFSFNQGSDLEANEVKTWAENVLNRQELAKIMGTIKTIGNTEIEVADTITISGFNAIWDRDTFVSGVKHTYRNGSWYTYFQCGMSHTSHAEEFNLNPTGQNNLVPSSDGLLYGKVLRYKESEKGHELIEVEIPSTNDEDNKQSIYARLMSTAAGKNGGFVFRPYPDDEVVIGFINNDPRFPVILGALFNSKNKFPYELNDDTQSEIGFSFNFKNEKDKDWKISIHQKNEKMTIASPNGQSFTLNDSEKSILMAFDDSNNIKITSEGIQMEASKIALKGTNGIELEGLKIEAKADTSMKLEGGTQLDLEGKVTASLKGQITQIN
ncbi:phage baseplate assembly protein V [Aquimarina longa]|uniref:phage baseplate assembly protein V n=1 Tax=Aquimarina longa TaxID=1080221 RepID=UPI0007835576|nr:phage baseplate assembly protein V [Aquimarina longa]